MDKDLLLTPEEMEKIIVEQAKLHHEESYLFNTKPNHYNIAIAEAQLTKIKSYYAEQGKGMELTEDEMRKVLMPTGGKLSTFEEMQLLLKAQLAKVFPIMEARQAEAVKAAKVELLNDVIEDLNQAVILHNEVKPNGNVVIKAQALHDMTLKYVRQRKSLTGGTNG